MKKFNSSSEVQSKVSFSYQGAKSKFSIQLNLKIVISISIILTGLGLGLKLMDKPVEKVVINYTQCINCSNSETHVKVIIDKTNGLESFRLK